MFYLGMVCAEFNFGGNRIQRNDNATCQKCPTAYNSSDAFKCNYNFHFIFNTNYYQLVLKK